MQQGTWSQEEHDRFLAGVKIYPDGPWRLIARYVGTRSVRQVQTHAQKYHEKIARRMRGLRKERRNHVRQEHRIDGDIFNMPPDMPMASLPFTPSLMAGPDGEHYRFPFDESAHGHAHMKHSSIQLPPLRFAMPLTIDRDELPEEPAFDYFARSMSNEAASAVV